MNILKKLPLERYIFEEQNEYFYFKNFFIKLKFLEYLKNNPYVLDTFIIKNSERADTIAYKVYGRSDLFWIIYLVNDVYDPSDWFMNDLTLKKFIDEKYVNPYSTHHYIRNGRLEDLKANRIMVEKRPFRTIDSLPEPDLIDPNTYFPVSNEDYEEKQNERKRYIKILKKEYLNDFLIDVDRKMRSNYATRN